MIAKFTGINKILQELEKGYAVNVGIMGSKADKEHDSESGLTNGYIGAIHEFGSISHNIPARSFLRVPLRSKLPLVLTANVKGLADSLAQGRFAEWLRQLGFACEAIVDNAFETSGDGLWKPLRPSTIRARKKKGSKSFLPLLDTGELRRSISSEVVIYED